MNLTDFDPDIVAAYHITEHDLRNVVRYITILQCRESHFEPSAAQIMRAVELLARLKALRKEMPK